jgi:hypothetical protein
MILTKRSCVLVLWLASTSAAAVPPGSSGKGQNPRKAPLMAPAEHTPTAPGRASDTDEREDAVTRRLRVIIDELKRKGPPPVGCMEG